MPKYTRGADGYYRENINTGLMNKNGKPIYKTIRSKTISGLKEKIEQYNNKEVTQELYINNKLTVDEYASMWLEKYKGGLRENTILFYKNLYKTHISPKIGNRRINDIRQIDCQGILTQMGKKYAAKTVKEVKNILVSIFKTAINNKYIDFNPTNDLMVYGAPQKERRELTNNEREKYLARL